MNRPHSHSADNEWYEREKAAFIAWWESGGQTKFSETPTIAAGAGWLARAEAAPSEMGEPVAWVYAYPNGTETLTRQPPDRVTRPEGYKITPLYERNSEHE